ncbi:MAG: FecR domain-containing protein [Deltaproteobacteria bacterium]|nr:FecR domain-containing protein [Deltaproteobacteria bacterium]
MKTAAIVGMCLGVSLAGACAWAAGPPVLEAVTGGDGVKFVRGGKAEVADEGDELQAGDRLQVGAKAAARILFGDGTHVTLSGGCDAEVARPLAGASGLVLHRGNLSATVAKPPTPVAVKPSAAADLRFYIKTNAAVMGVRGTEFVVDHDDAAGTKVHTLHGRVEVARSDDDLHLGRGVRLGPADRLRADKTGIGKPGRFDKAAFGRDRAKHHHLAAEIGKKGLRSRDDLRARWQARHKDRGDHADKHKDGKGGSDKAAIKAHGANGAADKKADRPARHEGGRPDKGDHRDRPKAGRRDRE